jgi:hypothetical protein
MYCVHRRKKPWSMICQTVMLWLAYLPLVPGRVRTGNTRPGSTVPVPGTVPYRYAPGQPGHSLFFASRSVLASFWLVRSIRRSEERVSRVVRGGPRGGGAKSHHDSLDSIWKTRRETKTKKRRSHQFFRPNRRRKESDDLTNRLFLFHDELVNRYPLLI